MSFVFCLLILSEQSHDGSRSFLSGNKEFGGHSCICIIEVVFLCCMYKQSRVLFLFLLFPPRVSSEAVVLYHRIYLQYCSTIWVSYIVVFLSDFSHLFIVSLFSRLHKNITEPWLLIIYIPLWITVSFPCHTSIFIRPFDNFVKSFLKMMVYYINTIVDVILVVSSNSGTLRYYLPLQNSRMWFLSRIIFKYYLKDRRSCTTDG